MGESGLIIHYKGTNWTKIASGITKDLWVVWGGSRHAVAVGAGGTIFPQAPNTTAGAW